MKSDIYALQVELTKNDIVSMRKEIAKKNSIFADKKYLDSLFLPSNIIGRKKQARQIIEYLESIQHGLLVPVISVYGKVVLENLQLSSLFAKTWRACFHMHL